MTNTGGHLFKYLHLSVCPGERGKPVHLGMDEKSIADMQIQQYGFNMVASDKIAMNRSIPDTRLEE